MARNQPGGGSWTVAHNGAGQPTMASVPNGSSQVWGYDPAGRPTSATWLQAGNPTFSQVATLDAPYILSDTLRGDLRYLRYLF